MRRLFKLWIFTTSCILTTLLIYACTQIYVPLASNHKVALLIPWKGSFPVWFNFYLQSLRINAPTYDFIFIVDAQPNISAITLPSNVHFKVFSKREPWELVVSRKVHEYAGSNSTRGIGILHKTLEATPYEICKLRPMFGIIFSDILQGYTHWGWTDLDIIFGDLTYIFSDSDLRDFDILTAGSGDDSTFLHGQLTIFQNSLKCNHLFAGIRGWSAWLPHTSKIEFGFEEGCFSSHVFRNEYVSVKMLPVQITERFYYANVGPTYNESWEVGIFWNRGRLYLHLPDDYVRNDSNTSTFTPRTDCPTLFWINTKCRNCGLAENTVYERQARTVHTYAYGSKIPHIRELAFMHFIYGKNKFIKNKPNAHNDPVWKLTPGHYSLSINTREA